MHPTRICILIGLLFLTCSLATPASAVGLIQNWKEIPAASGTFSGVTFSSDSDVIYAGGNQMLTRTWAGDRRWGGKSGFVAAMSDDGNYVLSAIANSAVLYGPDGVDFWTRNADHQIRAVAIAPNASYAVIADESGLIQTWAYNGDFLARNVTDKVKAIKISRDGSLIVLATDAGLKFYNPSMGLIWQDKKNGSWDELIAISSDGSTVITAGGTRVSSHTSTGTLNWMKDFTTSAVTDMAVSSSGDVIVVGDQNGKVHIINRFGLERVTFSAGQWVNAVSVSADGRLIAVGSLERVLYLLDGGGNVVAQLVTASIIQPRSVAISSDGGRLAYADLNTLFGYTIRQEPDITLDRTRPPQTREETFRTTVATTVVTTEEEQLEETPTLPPTTQAGTGVVIAMGGVALAFFARKGRGP